MLSPLFLTHTPRLCMILVAAVMASTASTPAAGQVASHPDAKSPLPDNPYLKHTDPWRWDVRTQLFLRAGIQYSTNPRQSAPNNNSSSERAVSVWWAMKDIEVIFPVVREGGFYWSPNEEVTATLRAGDFERETTQKRMYTKDTKSEYTLWRSEINQNVHQMHLIHVSHVVTADTVFDHKKAQFLPWPTDWNDEATGFLTPVVDSVGYAVAADAPDTIKTLLDFWVEDKDPKAISELDLVKFLSGKVIEHVQVRGPSAEFSTQPVNRAPINAGETFAINALSGNAWGGFVVRSAEVVAREPQGSKHDLATLLTSVLRSAGVPARTLICVNQLENEELDKVVSLVEFAMYDPDRDLTFWVPIDIDRLRLTGKRASQYKQWWNYFGTHDELSDYVPIAYYFHAPASYRAYDLPAFYGIRSSVPLPDYAIQAVLIDPMVSPITAHDKRAKP